MLDVELAAMRRVVEGLDYRPLFVTVSGAHLYGFPSSDSDVDLRGCHLLPLRDVVGLDVPNQTLEHKAVHDGTEVELVSHEVGKYLGSCCGTTATSWSRFSRPSWSWDRNSWTSCARWPAAASPVITITITGASSPRSES